MYILKLELTHFGKFHLKTIQFTPGLNVVYGKNEAGKSTIHAFVRSMLFGIPDTPEGKSRYERYLPWDSPQEYCGKLWLCREDKVYRIERNFMRGQTGLQLVNETDGIASQAPKQELKQLLCGLTENHYLNTICIEQLKSASEPQLANELQKLVINTSQSKNIRIDVEQAKDSLQKRREYLESRIVKDLDDEQKELDQKKAHTQAGISRLQKLRYVKSSQQRELVQKLEQEKLAADENLLSYERERDELRRRYEADQKAWDNAPAVDVQKAQRKPLGWMAMLLLTVFFGAATAFLYLTRGIYSDLGMLLVSGSLCLTVVCFVGIFAAYSIGKRRQESYRYNCEIVQKLQENLQESLKAFEACKQRAPQTLEDACRPIQEKLDQLDRELEYLRYQTEEEKKLQNTLEQRQKQLAQSRETNETYQEELDAVNIAMKTIQKVSVRIHDTFGNLLNTEASRLLFQLTNGRYDRLTIDPEMNVVLYNEDRAIPLSSVSRGTIEQIYLCIRMAAAGLLWQKEPMPFLFDDVFAFYDDERIEEAMKLLKDCGHQAIIFSCHTREDSLI